MSTVVDISVLRVKEPYVHRETFSFCFRHAGATLEQRLWPRYRIGPEMPRVWCDNDTLRQNKAASEGASPQRLDICTISKDDDVQDYDDG